MILYYILIAIIVLFGFLVPIFFAIYGVFCIIGDFLGAPYVPTSSKMVDDILAEADLKKGKLFVELGSGDGRITRRAVQKYQVKGLGIDIHPLLVWYSRILAWSQGLKDIRFEARNFFNVDLSQADMLFLFLLPHTLKKLRTKLQKECKDKCLIISHGFKIEDWDKYLIKKIDRKLFPTYYYRLK